MTASPAIETWMFHLRARAVRVADNIFPANDQALRRSALSFATFLWASKEKLIKQIQKSRTRRIEATHFGSLRTIANHLPRLRRHWRDDTKFIAPIAQEVNNFRQSFCGLGFVAVRVHEQNNRARRLVAQIFQDVVDLL